MLRITLMGELANQVVLNLWVANPSEGSPKTIGKHRFYIVIHNNSKENNFMVGDHHNKRN